MHYFHFCRNVEQYSAITYHGFCVGMGLMYVTLPRNIMQRFSKHSVLMLLKYPRVSQHLIAWNILAQNSSKQNFMGRVIMLSWKKKSYHFLTCWQLFHPFLSLHVKVNRHFLRQGVFLVPILFSYHIPYACFWVLPIYYALQGLSLRIFVFSCNETETRNVFLLLIFVCNCQSVLS